MPCSHTIKPGSQNSLDFKTVAKRKGRKNSLRLFPSPLGEGQGRGQPGSQRFIAGMDKVESLLYIPPMKLSHKSDYALTAVRYFTGLKSGETGSITQVAQAGGIPREFLAKVLRDLVKSGILKVYQGVRGGYALAKPCSRISFLEVIEAVDGPVRVSLLTMAPSNNPLKPGPSDLLLEQTLARMEKEVRTRLGKLNFGKYKGKPLERTRVEQTGPEPF
jgi:Rrf2 family transcriptional regulator, iron-sulfur cluster assembly transcription factor